MWRVRVYGPYVLIFGLLWAFVPETRWWRMPGDELVSLLAILLPAMLAVGLCFPVYFGLREPRDD